MVLANGLYNKKYDVPRCEVIRTQDPVHYRRYTVGALLLLLIVTLVCACFFLIVLKCSLTDGGPYVTNITLYWDEAQNQLSISDGHVIRFVVVNQNNKNDKSWLFKPEELPDEMMLTYSEHGHSVPSTNSESHTDGSGANDLGEFQEILCNILNGVVDPAWDTSAIPQSSPPRARLPNCTSLPAEELIARVLGDANAVSLGSDNSNFFSDLSATIDNGGIVFVQLIPLNVSEDAISANFEFSNQPLNFGNQSSSDSTSTTTGPTTESAGVDIERAEIESSSAALEHEDTTGSSMSNGKLGVEPVTARSNIETSKSERESFLRTISSRIHSMFHRFFQ